MGGHFLVSCTPVFDDQGNLEKIIHIATDITERIKAEKSYLLERDFSNEALNSLPGIFYMFDHTMKFLRWNANFEKVTEYPAEEIANISPLDLFTGPDKALIQERIQEVFEKGSSEAEADLVSKSGKQRPYFFTGRTIQVHENTYLIGMGLDITKRKLAENELRVSETRYRRITEAITDYIYTVRVEGGKVLDTKHGEGCTAVTGYTPEDFAADSYLWFHIVVQEDRTIVEKQARRVLAGKELPAIEHRIIRKDGVQRWVRNTPVARYDAHGNLQSYDGLIQDITERKLAEEALFFAEKKFRDLLETIQLVSVMLDCDGNITFCNDYLLDLTGWSRDEVLNKNWFDLFIPGEFTESVKSVFKENITKGTTLHNESFLQTRKGVRRLIVWNIAVLHNPDGSAAGTASIGIDVTDHRRLEDQLRQAQRMEAIGHLAGGVAHDFNNILTAIIGYASILRKRTPVDDARLTMVNQIIASSERAAKLVYSLLAYSRKQLINPEPLNINTIVIGVQNMLDRIIGEDIKVKLIISGNELIVNADKNQIEQVIINLASNSRDAMPKGGLLTVATEEVLIDSDFVNNNQWAEKGRYAVISITDTGTGMDEKTKEKIFDPFFTTKEVGKGTGLGLAMVYGTITQHNGFCRVYSEPGQGSTFRIYLPLSESGVSSPKAETAAAIRSGNETILLIEDDASVRDSTKSLLTELGYSVLDAVNGEHGINLFKENIKQIELVISDIIMPGQSGYDIYLELKKIRPDIKILFISGYSAEILSNKGIMDERTVLVSKPFNTHILSTKIREVLDN